MLISDLVISSTKLSLTLSLIASLKWSTQVCFDRFQDMPVQMSYVIDSLHLRIRRFPELLLCEAFKKLQNRRNSKPPAQEGLEDELMRVM